MSNLEQTCHTIRKDIVRTLATAGCGHPGGSLSAVEVVTTLYFDKMHIDPKNPREPDRDRFVLSKGHSVESYYAVLAAKGFFPIEKVMDEFSAFGSKFIGHPNNKLPGIEMNSGSLGHGLPVCIGMALASRMDGRKNRIYVVMGDGELAEGSVWEGFMAGGHYKLDNLCAIIDRNRLQISGSTEDVMHHEDLEDRIKSFGWHVVQVNGNDMDELDRAFEEARNTLGRPTAVIANTTKCFGGGPAMEDKAAWHHKVPTVEEYEAIAAELDRRREEALHE